MSPAPLSAPVYADALSDEARLRLEAQYGTGGKRYGAVADWVTIAKALYHHARGRSLAESFVRADHPAQLHYGLWRETTSSFDVAIRQASEQAFAALALTGRPARLVHLGSGFGGVDVQLCLAHPALETTGVSIDPSQVAVARELAALQGVAGRARFALANFLSFEPPGPPFDGGLALESICHVPELQLPLLWQRVHALLAPQARFVVHDWYLTRPEDTLSTPDRERLTVFLRGWDMPSCPTASTFVDAARDAGMTLVSDEDLTGEAWPSALRIHNRARLFQPLVKALAGRSVPFLDSLGLTAPDTRDFVATSLVQRDLFADGLLRYRRLVFARAAD